MNSRLASYVYGMRRTRVSAHLIAASCVVLMGLQLAYAFYQLASFVL